MDGEDGKRQRSGYGFSYKKDLDCHITNCLFGVTDGARTHDNRNHNPGLYQLSYSHH